MTLSRKVDLTVGNINTHLVRMAIPMTWGILAIISFQLVNTYWVSKLATTDLAAMTYTYPVTFAIFSIFLGFGIAMSAVISRLLGANEIENVRRVTTHGLVLVFIASLLVASLGHIFMNPLFSSMGASPEMIARIDDYMTLYWWGTFFICMPIVANSALRAGGDALIPAMVMTIAAVMNAIIDPILIFGLFGFPRLELQGAALSTVFANACAMCFSLTLMFKRRMICLSYLKNFKDFGDSAKRLLVIALPAGFTNILPTFYNAFVISLITSTSAAAVAAYGVVNRIEAFAFVILIGLVSAMTPILGQNLGANKIERVRKTLNSVFFFAFIWSVFVGVILVIFAAPLAQIFSPESEVQKIIIQYFIIISFCFPFAYLTSGWASAFNALGKPHIAFAILAGKTLLILIPAAYFGYQYNALTGLFWAIATAHTLSGIVIHLFALKEFKKI